MSNSSRGVWNRQFLFFLGLLLLYAGASSIPTVKEVGLSLRWAVPVLFTLMAGLGFATWQNEYTGTRPFKGFDIYMLGWIAFAFLSAFWSIEPYYTVGRSGTLLVFYVVIFWVVWALADQVGEDRVVKIIVWAVASVFISSFVLALIPITREVAWEGGRFQGLIESPNGLGAMGALTVPLIVRQVAIEESYIYHALVFLVVGEILLTGQRSSIGITLGVFVFIYVMSYGKKSVKSGIFILFLYSIVAYFMYREFLYEKVIRYETLENLSTRETIWGLMIGYIEEKPLIGHGFGTEDFLHEWYGVSAIEEGFRGIYAANSYIGLTAQTGILGAATFFGPLVFIFCKSSLFGRTGGIRKVTMAAVLLAGLVLGITESWTYAMGNLHCLSFWTIVMLLVRRSVIRRAAQPKSTPRTRAQT
jgi:O-antigen ligase